MSIHLFDKAILPASVILLLFITRCQVAILEEFALVYPDEPRKFQATEGEKEDIIFTVKATYPPTAITLIMPNLTEAPKSFYNESYVPGENNKGVVTVTILHTSLADSGNYTLRITNSRGSGLIDFQLLVMPNDNENDDDDLALWLRLGLGLLVVVVLLIVLGFFGWKRVQKWRSSPKDNSQEPHQEQNPPHYEEIEDNGHGVLNNITELANRVQKQRNKKKTREEIQNTKGQQNNNKKFPGNNLNTKEPPSKEASIQTNLNKNVSERNRYVNLYTGIYLDSYDVNDVPIDESQIKEEKIGKVDLRDGNDYESIRFHR